jgi:hypothetical protein
MELMDPSFLWVPNFEHYDGITDRYVVLSRKNIEAYLGGIMKNIMCNIPAYFNDLAYRHDTVGYVNLEQSIQVALNFELGNNYSRLFPFIMYSIRAKEDATRCSPGIWMDELGYYVKYEREYIIASHYAKIYKTTDDWYKNQIELLSNAMFGFYDNNWYLTQPRLR